MISPIRPGKIVEATEAEKAILDECAETDEHDSKSGVDARKFLAELLRKTPEPSSSHPSSQASDIDFNDVVEFSQSPSHKCSNNSDLGGDHAAR